jgi:hypothetical protein
MTDEDIRRQKADALLAHREAKERAAHVHAKVKSIGVGIRIIGAKLETSPEEFLPSHELTGEQAAMRARRPQLSFSPPSDVANIVDLDSVIALAKELREADREVSEAAKNAVNLGVPVS